MKYLAVAGLFAAAISTSTTYEASAQEQFSAEKNVTKEGRVDQNSFFRDVKISVEGTVGDTRHKAGQPAALDKSGPTARISVSSRLGDYGFGEIGGQFAKERFSSTVVQTPLDLKADGNTRGLDFMLGAVVHPGLRAGILGGIGNGDVTYDFTTFSSPNDSSASSHRYGAFIGGIHDWDAFTLSADLSYLNVKNEQTYLPTNSVTTAKWRAEYLTMQVLGRYAITPAAHLSGGFSIHHVLSQTVAPADTPLDTVWGSLQFGGGYMVTENLEVNLSGVIWVGNDKFNQRSLTVGASYKF